MNDDQRELKKRWVAEQKSAARAAFPLSDPELAELAALFAYVDGRLAESDCDHSLRLATAWLEQHGHAPLRVIAWLRENGGFCDWEVGANACDHWEQDRCQ